VPIYEYSCCGCGQDFEFLVLGSQDVRCPKCQSQDIKRKMSAFSHKSEDGGFVSSQGSGCSGCTSTNCNSCH